MKKLYRNVIILTIAFCFSAAGFVGINADAQIKTAKLTSTPKAKKSPTVAVKATPKPTAKPKSAATQKPAVKSTPTAKTKTSPTKTEKSPAKSKPPTAVTKPSATPQPTPKSAALSQIIVTATASRIRQQPKTNSAQLSFVKLGKLLPVSEKNAAWYRVEYAAGKSGWISKTIVKDYETEQRDEIYREIADKYSKSKTPDFATAAEVCEFLGAAQLLVRKDNLKADLSLRRLRLLSAALRAIPFGKGEQFPYKPFLKANEKDVIYSDPSAEWFVRSELFWELHNKYSALPVAEDIAWEAAKNPIPGECEGYVNCQLYVLRATEGEYLNFYPNGKYSRKALELVTANFEILVAGMNNKETFTPLADISDRAEFNRFLTELRTIISKIADVDKAKPLQQINQLGEGYK